MTTEANNQTEEDRINQARYAEIESRNQVRKWAINGVREAQRRAKSEGDKSLRERAKEKIKQLFNKDDGPPKEIYPFW